MSTIRAIRNLGDDLAAAVEQSGQVLQFSAPDHDAGVEKLADLHRSGVAERSQRIADTKKALRKTTGALNAEIDRLKAEIAEAKAGAAAKIAADEKVIAASRAFLAAIET